MKKILFISEHDEDCNLECHENGNNEVCITITDNDSDHAYNEQLVTLDVSTALELIDHLKEIVELIKTP